MRRVIATTAAAALLTGPAAADMRDAFKKQQKATDYLNSCLHYDKAQWQGILNWGGENMLLRSQRVLIRPDKTLLITKEDFLYTLRPESEKRTCRSVTPIHGARKMGSHTHLYSDGSGSKNQTVIEGDFLVTYHSWCLKWKCTKIVDRHVFGVRIGSPSYEAVKQKN